MRWGARGVVGVVLSALAGCAGQSAQTAPPAPAVLAPVAAPCLLPSQQRMLVAELFFGRDRAGRQFVGDHEWATFLGDVVTPNFPDGLTVFDGYGQWRNPASGVIGRSPHVKIVLIAVKPGPDVPGRLTAVIDAYKTRFQQQSVGIVTREECAAF
jgi:hypothetical protein